jgi:hypothetical protein
MHTHTRTLNPVAPGHVSPGSRYLAALCCLELRQYTEAESLLIGHGEAQVRGRVCSSVCACVRQRV